MGRAEGGAQVFVDETKRRDYLLVAGVAVVGDLDAIRAVLRTLILPGQRRLHMNSEGDSRRRSIASAIAASPVRATVYDAGRRYKTERHGRAACLQALVKDAARHGHGLIVLEQDDSLISWDTQHLIEFTRAAGCRDSLRYEHRRAASEQLLAIPDAIAWCWAKGGDWRRRVEPAVVDVQRV